MKIEAVDFFYLSMPEVTTEADGSQDALRRAGAGRRPCRLGRVRGVAARLDRRLRRARCRTAPAVPSAPRCSARRWTIPPTSPASPPRVDYDSMDLLQAAHTLSGVEMALWDLLGKAQGEPVYRLLGYQKAHPKTPYASQLFGDTPAQTLDGGAQGARDGFPRRQVRLGAVRPRHAGLDADHLPAAREGLGADGILLVDAGQIWGEDVETAAQRLPALEKSARSGWRSRSTPARCEAYGALAAAAHACAWPAAKARTTPRWRGT